MRKSSLVCLALVVLGVALATGYVWGRRDGLVAEQNNMLMLSPALAAMIRENRPDVVLRIVERQMDWAALGIKDARGLPNPLAVCKDIRQRIGVHTIPLQRSSEYIDHYPHPGISDTAVAYIEAESSKSH